MGHFRYKSPIWKSIRRHRLHEEPQCRECAIEGRTVPASHVDHIEPHRGEWSLFMQYETHKAYVFVTTTLIGINEKCAL